MSHPSADEHLAVLDLLALYGHVVDARAWDRLRDVFVAEAVVDAQYEVATGIDEIAAYLSSFDANRSHFTTNVVVRADGQGLRALSKFLVVLSDNSTVVGDYVDRFTRQADGELRILHRQMNLRGRADRAPNGEPWRVEPIDAW